MYIITAVRMGNWLHFNRHAKGPFKIRANTLEELVRKMVNGRPKLYYPNLRAELTANERRVVNVKFKALIYKRSTKNKL